MVVVYALGWVNRQVENVANAPVYVKVLCKALNAHGPSPFSFQKQPRKKRQYRDTTGCGTAVGR